MLRQMLFSVALASFLFPTLSGSAASRTQASPSETTDLSAVPSQSAMYLSLHIFLEATLPGTFPETLLQQNFWMAKRSERILKRRQSQNYDSQVITFLEAGMDPNTNVGDLSLLDLALQAGPEAESVVAKLREKGATEKEVLVLPQPQIILSPHPQKKCGCCSIM